MFSLPLHEWLSQQLPALQAAQPALSRRQLIVRLIRQAILDGTLPAPVQLPSTRTLSAELGIARNTVVSIYETLQDEGLVAIGHGSGTYVCRVAADTPAAAPASVSVTPAAPEGPAFSARGQAIVGHPLNRFYIKRPFCAGVHDLTLFPLKLWHQLQQRHWKQDASVALAEGEAGGLPALRQAIAEHLRVSRGVRCEAAQVIITDGTSQSLDLIARLLADTGDVVWFENPGHWAASKVFDGNGLRLQPVDVDDDGMPCPPASAAPPRLVYLTPSHQFPLGGVMPLARRQQWLQFAQLHGSVLLEDDYDSEYRFGAAPLPSLQGLDGAQRVIYLGTFSKTLFVGIRLAYLVVPPALAAAFAHASADLYREGEQVGQAVLADFIREGHYASHLRRTRVIYAERRQVLVATLQAALAPAFAAGTVAFSGADVGVHLTLRLPDAVDDEAVAQAAAEAGISVLPLSGYCTGTRRSGLVLSYAATSSDAIVPLARQLGAVIAAALAASVTTPAYS
ncbi:MAG: PLP-dependent aminotransferase family protein [Sphingomonadaceae bacterium]